MHPRYDKRIPAICDFPVNTHRAAALFIGTCLLAIIAGIIFRCTFIDRKTYGHDETITSIRVAGETLGSYRRAVSEGRFHSVGDLRAFLRPKGSAAAVVASLATEDPQHPPLYYLLESGLQRLFGDAVATRRMLSVGAGIFLIPAVAWWAWELFATPSVCAAAAALVAVSPLHLWYAQTAREYSMWALATALSCALLLRAIRLQRPRPWVAYGVATLLGLYTFTLHLCVLAAHALFVFFAFPDRRVWNAFTLSAGGALLLFVPWLLNLALHERVVAETTSWFATALPLHLLMMKWAFSAAAPYFDLVYTDERMIPAAAAFALLAPLALIVLALRAGRNKWCVLALAVLSAAALCLPDLIRHQSWSTAPRFLMPTLLAGEIAVACLIVRLPALLPIALLAGVISCVHGLPLTNWWTEVNGTAFKPAARIIAASPRPVLLINPTSYALELIAYLDDSVRVAQTPQAGYDNFLMALSDAPKTVFPGLRYEQQVLPAMIRARRIAEARSELAQARVAGSGHADESIVFYRLVPSIRAGKERESLEH
jgi:uncharacterized membrane protein